MRNLVKNKFGEFDVKVRVKRGCFYDDEWFDLQCRVLDMCIDNLIEKNPDGWDLTQQAYDLLAMFARNIGCSSPDGVHETDFDKWFWDSIEINIEELKDCKC